MNKDLQGWGILYLNPFSLNFNPTSTSLQSSEKLINSWQMSLTKVTLHQYDLEEFYNYDVS